MKRTLFSLILILSINFVFAQNDNLNQKLLKTPYKYYKYNRYRNHYSAIELVKKGADINAKNKDGKTLLHLASEFNNIDLVKLLCYYNADIKVIDSSGNTPRDLADDENNIEIFNFLNKPEFDMYFLAKYGSFEDFKKELNKNIDDINKPDKYGFTVLDHAVCRSHDGMEPVKFLINKGVDLNFNYANALDITIENNNKVLATFFATPEITKKHIRPLNVAIDEHNLDMVKLLVENGTNINGEDYLSYKPIIYALRYKLKNKDIINYLIDKGVDIHFLDWRNRNILHLLCYYNDEYFNTNSYSDPVLVEKIIASGFKINAADNNNKTALHYAAENPDAIESLKLLLKYKADVNIEEEDGSTPLDLAFQKGNNEAVKIFIENGADVTQIDKNGNCILHIAASNNASPELMKILLDKGIDINSKNKKSQTPLFLASEKAVSNDLIKMLINSGADVNSKDVYNSTSLINAVKNRKFETVKKLVEAGADMNAVNNGNQSALKYAAYHSMTDIANYLIMKGADTKELDIVSPTEHNNIELVKILITKGIDVNKVNYSEKRPLTIASTYGFTEIAKILINNGADVNYSDDSNEAPLLSALSNNHIAIVNLLINAGVDVKTRVSDKTALHYAAEVKDGYNITKLLIEKGANVSAVDKNNMSPLHYAYKYNNIKTANLLKSKMSIENSNTKSKNLLVKNDMIMYDRIPLDSTHYDRNTSDIVNKLQSELYYAYEDFNSIDLIKSLYDKVTTGKIPVYEDYNPYLQNKENMYNPKLSVNEINERFGGGIEILYLEDIETGEFIEKEFEAEPDLTEINGLLTFDKWFYDNDNFKFYKDVVSFSPIRKYSFSDGFELENARYQQVAYIDFENYQTNKYKKKLKKDSKLFKKIKYEFLIDNIDSYFLNDNEENSKFFRTTEKERSPYWNSHSKQQLIHSLTDRVISGKSNAYDFETGELLSIEEIYQRFAALNDTILIEVWNEEEFDLNTAYEIVENNINFEEIKSLIFIEDWYLDESTMQIRKEIIGVAPVRCYYPYDDFEMPQRLKSIPFVVYFNDSKPNTFDSRKISLSVPIDNNYMTLKSSIYNNNFYYWEENTDFDIKKEFVNQASNERLQLYSNYSYDQKSIYNENTYERIDTTEFLFRIGLMNDTVISIDPNTGSDIEEIISREGYGTDSICVLYSHEDWTFNKEDFSFSKNIFSYSPAIRFYRDDDFELEMPRFKLIGYHLNNEDNSKKMQLFKKIKYEFGFEIIEKYLFNGIPNIESDKPLFWNSYNQKNFKELIFNMALSGEVNAYDFDSGKKLSLNELNEKLILKNDTIETVDPETGEIINIVVHDKITHSRINSFIFIENWYIDTGTFDIKKEVIGIAPVTYNYEYKNDNEEVLIKVIPFVLYFDETKRF